MLWKNACVIEEYWTEHLISSVTFDCCYKKSDVIQNVGKPMPSFPILKFLDKEKERNIFGILTLMNMKTVIG